MSDLKPLAGLDSEDQDAAWSRHAARYERVFLNAFDPRVENPAWRAFEALQDSRSKTVADLGCGPGVLLPMLARRFGRVIGLDFAPKMIARAKKRIETAGLSEEDQGRVTLLTRPMSDLDDFAGQVDVAVAVSSLVMPDTREIDRSLRAIHQSLRPGGLFLGVVPSIDSIHYHTMLLMDRALDEGLSPAEAEHRAALEAEHHEYEFAFGRFMFQGLRQKFWQPFEVRYRLKKAGFRDVELDQVLYPWSECLDVGDDFDDHPPSWDWSFTARP